MILHPFCTAAGEPAASTALYVILAGVVCTGVGWWLRVWYVSQKRGGDQPVSASEIPHEDESAMQEERGKLASQLAAMELALADSESARRGALDELETLRPKALSHDEARERAHRLESEHRKALENLSAAESSMKAARQAEEEARTEAVDPARISELNRQIEEWRSRETTARAAAATAAEESRAAAEESARLRSELEAARAALEEERASGSSSRERAEQLVRDLDAARARIASIESSPSVPPPIVSQEAAEAAPFDAGLREELDKVREEVRSSTDLNNCLRRELEEVRAGLQQASSAAASEQTRATQLAIELDEARARGVIPEPSPIKTDAVEENANVSSQEIDEARQETETARRELKTAQEEIRKLKAELSAPKPRPILTSPRPDGGTGARPV